MPEDVKALIISYAFPPVGGAGVQRSVKLAKWLNEYGIRPSILTVSNPSVPLQDKSFDGDLPAGMPIHRAPTLEPRYSAKQTMWSASDSARASLIQRLRSLGMGYAKQLLLPDPQVLWVPGALLNLARQLSGGDAPDVVLITAPPFSQFLLAPAIRAWRRTGIVIDYRDEWSTASASFEMLSGRVSSVVGAKMEKALVRSAHVITTATDEFRHSLMKRFPEIAADRIRVVTNGYDPDDFANANSAPPEDRFVVSYAGTVFKLTSARGLLGAVRLLHRDSPELAQLLEIRFMGRIVDTERDYFDGMEKLGVRQLGYVPHGQVLARLSESHMVLCLLDDVPGVERVYPAKIFELMNLGRRVLCLAPEGALTRLVRTHRLGDVIVPRDEAEIATYLARQLKQFRDGQRTPPETESDPADLMRYHRRVIAGQFAAAMREAIRIARAQSE
jgi:glycosyltransferase involved in cell wall biosynthesis